MMCSNPSPISRICLAAMLSFSLDVLTYRLAAGEPKAVIISIECDEDKGDDSADEKVSYGPPECQTRGTLFQWSYGTSFSGRPDLDEPLVTDRPDFTEASTTVGRGVAQLEFGYTYTYDHDGTDGTKAHAFPETLLRYGVLFDWLEMRVAWNFAAQEIAELRDSGSEDIYLAAKIALTPQEGFLPEMALMPQMTVPTGDDGFTSDHVLPGLNWLYGWDITEKVGAGGSTQFNRAVDEETGDTYTEWAQSFTINISWGEKLGSFTEWYVLVPHSADTALPEHYFDGGFTYLISNDIQWDIRAGVGLNDHADDYFLGTGLSIRFK